MNYKLSLIVFFQIIFIGTLQAQDAPLQKSDTSTVLKYKPVQPHRLHPNKKMSTSEKIKLDLNNLMDRYISSPNTQETWKKVKSEATALLWKYFTEGSLMGKRTDQAYFAKIGLDTMTQVDIANGKMILQVGIAPQKPAEFEILVFERMVAGNQGK